MGQETLTVYRAAWTPAHAALLEPAVRHEPFITVETLRHHVELDMAQLLDVRRASGEVVGAVVVRIERRELGAEGVVVAAGGRFPGVDLTHEILPVLEFHLRGVDAIRIHTARPGMLIKLRREGYRFREWVLAKAVR